MMFEVTGDLGAIQDLEVSFNILIVMWFYKPGYHQAKPFR